MDLDASVSRTATGPAALPPCGLSRSNFDACGFSHAEIDPDTDEPDPEQIRLWGMELPEGHAVVYWRAEGKSRFATFGSASRAAQRFGPLYDLALIYP